MYDFKMPPPLERQSLLEDASLCNDIIKHIKN